MTITTEDNSSVRFNAAVDRAKRGDPDAIPILIDALGHKSFAIRFRWARQGLASLGKLAVPALKQALKGDSYSRVAAAYILHHIDNSLAKLVLPVVVESLGDSSREVQRDAAWVLGELGQESVPAVPSLLLYLTEPKVVPPGCQAPWFTDAHCEASWSLARIGEPIEEIVPALIEALRCPEGDSEWKAWGAARALWRLGRRAPQAFPALVRLWRDDQNSARLRIQAAYAFAAIGTPARQVVPALLSAAEDRDDWIRTYSIRLLGDLCEKTKATGPKWKVNAAIPSFIQALRDESHHVRRSAARSLAQGCMWATPAIHELVGAMEAEDAGGIAAEALAKIGDPAVTALKHAAEGANETVGHFAQYALDKTAMMGKTKHAEQGISSRTIPTYSHFFMHSQR